MKRIVLSLLLVAALLAGCAGGAAEETTAAQALSPLELLQAGWDALPEDSRFAAYGGDDTEDGPGAYRLENTDTLQYTLLVPETLLGSVKEAASLVHMLNANTFTCGAFRLEGVSAEDFAKQMQQSIEGNQWLCGIPEKMVIATAGGDTVVAMFGAEELLSQYCAALQAACPELTVVADEAIA